VFAVCGIALAVLIVGYLAGRAAGRRLARASEMALTTLRVRTFAHIHRLSLAEQSRERRGVFVARVTADIDTLSKFTEWGGIAWIVTVAQVLGALELMLLYSWQLTIPVVLLVIPLLAIVLRMQTALSAAYDLVRTRVGEMLSEVSESVMGAGVVRAYGLDDQTACAEALDRHRRYHAQVHAHLRAARMFPIAVLFWGIALSVIGDRRDGLRSRVGRGYTRGCTRAGSGPRGPASGRKDLEEANAWSIEGSVGPVSE
jgi:ATP-binding cassette, subfamily B, bacterial